MKHFFIKISLFAISIAFTCLIIEFLLRRIPNEYTLKRDYLDKNSDMIEVLFLGGSHGRSAFNPASMAKRSFNAAQHSQSLDYDFEILKKYRNKFSNLQFIVLPVSYGTLFSKLAGGPEAWRAKSYIIYFDIVLSDNIRYHTEIMNGILGTQFYRLYSYYIRKIDEVNCTDLGWGKANFSNDLNKTGIDAAKRHAEFDDYKYFKEMTSILDSIASFAKSNNTKLIMITTPTYKSYRENLKKSQLDSTINAIRKIVSKNENCYYLNFFEDSSFYETDFRDGDHLNAKGAKKLTLRIDSILNNNKIINKYN